MFWPSRGWSSMRIRCHPGRLPKWSAAVPDVQGPQRSNVSAIFGPIWPWLSPELGPRPLVTDGDLGTGRARLAESILQLLARAGSGEPLLLLVDDANRIDEGSCSLLHTLLNRRWARPVVVVLAYRTEAGGRRMRIEGPLVDLLGREGTTIVEAGLQSEPDLAVLDQPPGSRRAPDADPENVAVRLRQRTAGIPLLVREVLASATDIER